MITVYKQDNTYTAVLPNGELYMVSDNLVVPLGNIKDGQPISGDLVAPSDIPVEIGVPLARITLSGKAEVEGRSE